MGHDRNGGTEKHHRQGYDATCLSHAYLQRERVSDALDTPPETEHVHRIISRGFPFCLPTMAPFYTPESGIGP